MGIVERANELNAKIKASNEVANRQLGQKEAAEEAYKQAVASYKERYGVEITPENLQAEYNKVYGTVKGELEQKEEIMASIERGDYHKEVELSIELEPDVEAIKPAEEIPAPPVKEEKEEAEAKTVLGGKKTTIESDEALNPIGEPEEEMTIGIQFEEEGNITIGEPEVEADTITIGEPEVDTITIGEPEEEAETITIGEPEADTITIGEPEVDAETITIGEPVEDEIEPFDPSNWGAAVDVEDKFESILGGGDN